MNNRIYLDNAATTPLHPLVLEAMMPYLTTAFGNPSSIYSYGRESRMAIEDARKTVAKMLHASPSEIFFTSGGTESSNTAIQCAVRDLNCKHIISSSIEHHATLHTIEYFARQDEVSLSYVKLSETGAIDMTDLERLLSLSTEKCLVTIMHANNEIGNISDIKTIGQLCKKYGAIFHSDTVQTVGHYNFDLQDIYVHFITGASHKFHGPKGVGMLYINKSIKVHPFIHGGGQERNMRAGTENLYGIIGFAKALEIATENLERDHVYIRDLKKALINKLVNANIPLSINGDLSMNSLYTVLSVNFPKTEKMENLIFELDKMGICVSGGSACSGGGGSHVMQAIGINQEEMITVRFSFSKHNTFSELDTVTAQIKSLCA